jgi:hypothetical protein
MGDASTLDAKTRASWDQLLIGFDQRPAIVFPKEQQSPARLGRNLDFIAAGPRDFPCPIDAMGPAGFAARPHCLRAHSAALIGKIGPNSGEAPDQIEPEVCSTIAMERPRKRSWLQ